MVHELDRRGDISGLDADLNALANPARAAKYRRENADRMREQTEEAEVLRVRKVRKAKMATLERKIQVAEKAVVKARGKGKRTGLAQGRLERATRRRDELAAKL